MKLLRVNKKLKFKYETIDIDLKKDMDLKITPDKGINGYAAVYDACFSKLQGCDNYLWELSDLVFVEEKDIKHQAHDKQMLKDQKVSKYYPFGIFGTRASGNELAFEFFFSKKVAGDLPNHINLNKAAAMLEEKGYWTLRECLY